MTRLMQTVFKPKGTRMYHSDGRCSSHCTYFRHCKGWRTVKGYCPQWSKDVPGIEIEAIARETRLPGLPVETIQ